ncbi:poly(hydroxyalkanoate) depolymerase family esterase [Rhodovulum steppense]|uniref:Poly(Hydroxyalkanoate) depolymerase family esterase n=2 Tax=Rhodovulum steppense TaxID=540251 RepID=A0A4V2R3J8_9RHOB|nr:poly(hydroxyalkanoate) depolymerase family esterase [Rhodovulum steppense]
MKFTIPRTMRRAMRLARAGKPRSSARAMQRAIGAAVIKTTLETLSTLQAMTPGKPTVAIKHRKPPAKARRKAASRAGAKVDRRLSAVVKQLRAARSSLPARLLLDRVPTPSRPPPIPRGAQYLDRTYRGRAGTRDFKLFLPAGQSQGPTGLILMLHGCSQNPDDFATGTDMNALAQKHGLAVAWPEQTRDHNGASCWNWFVPVNQARGRGEPAILAGLTRALMREFGLDRQAVFVAGLSAGGAMAVIVAETYPDVFSAVGVHSGLARGAASDVMSALSAMRSGGTPAAARARRPAAAGSRAPARRIVFHGDADSAVHPSNAPQIVLAAVGSRTPARVTPAEAAGRSYLRTEYALPDGTVDVELWQVAGAGHAWSGGKAGGSFTDSRGPDASAEMVGFFLARPR